jgi:flagellar hook protein FlgE
MRYINSFISYNELYDNKQSYIKTYVEPGNKLNIYRDLTNNGLIILNDTLTHQVKIDLFDDSGNKTSIAFKVKKSGHKKSAPNSSNLSQHQNANSILWNYPFVYESDNIKISLPEESLYANVNFTIDSSAMQKDMYYSPIWNICKANIPLHKRMTIGLLPNIPDSLRSKAVIVGINKAGKITAFSSFWDEENKFISANVPEFGSYTISIDTISPTVKINIKNGSNLSNKKAITVTIADNLSGIASYNGYIDEQWALFDYDAKNHLLTYIFDPSRIKKGKRHKLTILVNDACGNTTSADAEFIW